MTTDQMRHAIAVEAEAQRLNKQFTGWVLLRCDQATKPEVINVGDPVSYKQNEYHRMTVEIPDAVRRLAFRQWKKELALKYNAKVRELNQLGVSTNLRLIEFNPATGEPITSKQ